MSTPFVYPPRNLPGLAEAWGRAVETRDNIFEKNLTQTNQKLENSLRSTSGQLAVTAEQITELQARSVNQVSPESISVTGNATTAPFPTASVDFSFPAPVGARRSAILFLSCTYESDSSSVAASIFPEILLEGERIWTGSPESVPKFTSAPPGWADTTSAFAAVRVGSDLAPTFTFRIHRVGFQSQVTTITANNIQAVLWYGDRY